MWSVVEKTALAEAEIEYHDHTSDTVHVRFPVLKSKGGKLDGAAVVIWTTTPWTLPSNQFAAVKADLEYAVLRESATADAPEYIVAEPLAASLRRSRSQGALPALDRSSSTAPLPAFS